MTITMTRFLIQLCICVLLTHVNDHYSEAIDVLSLLFEENEGALRREMTSSKEQEKTKIISRLSQVPFTNKVKSDAWYKLTKFRKVDMIHDSEWKMYEPLIPYMPPQMFQMVNYTDEGVLRTFGQFKLNPTQLSMIAEEISEKWGSKILEDKDKVLKMGNIFCGFPEKSYEKLNSSTLKFLLKSNFFQTLHGCTVTALQALTKELQRYTIIGPTRAWTPETTTSLGVLIAGLNAQQIRSLRDNCIARITPDVVEMIPVKVLMNLRQEQLQAFKKESLLQWRRKTKDLRYLFQATTESSSTFISLSPLTLTFFLLLCTKILQ